MLLKADSHGVYSMANMIRTFGDSQKVRFVIFIIQASLCIYLTKKTTSLCEPLEFVWALYIVFFQNIHMVRFSTSPIFSVLS